MYITSTINALTKSNKDVPVLLLCHGNKRKLVQRPKNYKELVLIVREKFNLGHGDLPLFEISTLDICRGKSIEVDESAYEDVCSLLDEVTVVVEQGVINTDKSRETLSTIFDRPLSTSEATPREDDKGMSHEHSTTSHKPSATISVHRRAEATDREHLHPTPSKKLTARAILRMEEGSEDEAPSERSYTPSETEAQDEYSGCATPDYSSAHPTEDEDVQNIAPTPASQSYRTPKADSKRTHAPERIEEAYQTSRNAPQTPEIKLKTEGPNIRTDDPRTPAHNIQENMTPTRSAKRGIPKPSVAYDDYGVVPPSSSQVSQQAGLRYKVHISGPLPEHQADFMTRGKHPVRKVLAGACKTFGLDYQRARLMLVVPAEDEDGFEHEVECAKEDTMAGSGATKNARLVVQVDEDEEDEMDDSD